MHAQKDTPISTCNLEAWVTYTIAYPETSQDSLLLIKAPVFDVMPLQAARACCQGNIGLAKQEAVPLSDYQQCFLDFL